MKTYHVLPLVLVIWMKLSINIAWSNPNLINNQTIDFNALSIATDPNDGLCIFGNNCGLDDDVEGLFYGRLPVSNWSFRLDFLRI